MLQLFVQAQKWLSDLRDGEEGQTAVEYALVLVLVAIVLATALAALGGALDDVVAEIRTALGV